MPTQKTVRLKVEKKQTSNVSGETKILERFLKGRVEKEVKRKSLENGSTYNSKSVEKLRRKIAEDFIDKIPQPQPEQHLSTPPIRELSKDAPPEGF